MNRAIILVIDGFGVGAAPDADVFGDTGANTLAHIAEAWRQHHKTLLSLPNLASLGLAKSCEQNAGYAIELKEREHTRGAAGSAAEISSGKDTPSGHWEMTGVPVLFDWGYYPNQDNCFPKAFLDELIHRTSVPGILGGTHASGTDIIRDLGEEHVRTGRPICYTSADSVFQVAAHEKTFGLDRLYHFCETAREMLYQDNIGRVIARPFIGKHSADYARTGNRRDYSIEPPEETLLDQMVAEGLTVNGIGKISDIFAHRGISSSTKATGLKALIDESLRQIKEETDTSLIFTNLVNFDQDFGHRRDPLGYAEALIYFDSRLNEIMQAMRNDDLLLITSDHGCDPTWKGTEHTRECVPILAWHQGLKPIDIGIRDTFADTGQTLADWFGLKKLKYGQSFLQALS